MASASTFNTSTEAKSSKNLTLGFSSEAGEAPFSHEDTPTFITSTALDFGNVDEGELRIFEQFWKELGADWPVFANTFLLYLEGIISRFDFMTIFHESFAPRLNDDLRK